ncbi:Lrp/AsnC family transcriptional regulator [Patulibacter sp. SYSU D01012]|uniref:Lrp/AsnC family transcriptional regulator n=1 Tax=Patulibacter sp. SYSU D01012 TaxID=2817381 RepID=UPI001B30BF8E|nr:Lrp/AsnC family transcriptional regulator [Patulibacter sp. SYSU D01012]
MPESSSETLTLDRLDRRLIHALLHDGRAPFRTIAAALGSSEQTVARRYRRLRDAGVLRVLVVPDHRRVGERHFLRIAVDPRGALPVARALSARPDVSWVTIASGATEVTCTLDASTPEHRDALLLEGLPRVSRVTGVRSAEILHAFVDAPETEWHALPDGLTDDERAALGPGTAGRRPHPDVPSSSPLGPDDEGMLRELARDGRTSTAALAAATGRTEARVRRRLDALLADGAVYTDVELATTVLGFGLTGILWCTAEPAALAAAGDALAAVPETTFVAATSGATNLIATLLARDRGDLYRILTEQVGPVPGLLRVETVPAMRLVKQRGAVMEGDRLALEL